MKKGFFQPGSFFDLFVFVNSFVFGDYKRQRRGSSVLLSGN